MKHVGDITKLNGAELPVVDVITGGSPCQDLSVAGKRAGLAGERSGLFMEQIRIVKEMREHDRQCNGRTGFLTRPRFMVWENVPGAFSSNKGEDFAAVLTEIIKICEPEAPDVQVPEGGKWPKAGLFYDDMGRWSIAWRVHDAQFWGVPQRRKRISLIADFGGLSAPEILFERKGMRRDSEESGQERQGTTESSEGGSHQSSFTLKIRGGVEVDSAGKKAGKGPLVQTELSGTLGVSQDQTLITLGDEDVVPIEGNGSRESHKGNGYGEAGDPSFTLNSVEHHAVAYGISSYDSNAMKSGNPNSGIYEADTSRTLDNSEARTPIMIFEPGKASRLGGFVYEDISPTLMSSVNDNHPCIIDARSLNGDEVVGTLVSSMTTAVGNTQDRLNIIVTEQKDEDGEH